jgi:hypothetical protein
MTRPSDRDTWQLSQPAPYVHQVALRRRDQAHYLALCRHTARAGEEILRLALADGLAQRAKRAVGVTPAALTALEQILAWQEDHTAPIQTPHTTQTEGGRGAMMTLETFLATYTGHDVDYDHAYGAQCMDLANQYVTEVLGLPALAGNAIDTFRATAGFAPIVNTAHNAPAPGDVVVWGGPNASVGTSQYGHIAICVDATPQTFHSFDQNWPEGSAPHIQEHSYTAVLGWLHPIRATAGEPPVPPLPATTPAPATAAAAIAVLTRHAAALTEAPSVAGTNALLAAIKREWPVYTK